MPSRQIYTADYNESAIFIMTVDRTSSYTILKCNSFVVKGVLTYFNFSRPRASASRSRGDAGKLQRNGSESDILIRGNNVSVEMLSMFPINEPGIRTQGASLADQKCNFVFFKRRYERADNNRSCYLCINVCVFFLFL